MARQYLTDTNSIVDYLNTRLPAKATAMIDNTVLHLSVITRIELMAWSGLSSKQMQFLQTLITGSIIYDLDEPTILATINIRKQYKIKLPDAIIAATALVNNLTLLTRNLSDFKKITGLEALNPYQF